MNEKAECLMVLGILVSFIGGILHPDLSGDVLGLAGLVLGYLSINTQFYQKQNKARIGGDE